MRDTIINLPKVPIETTISKIPASFSVPVITDDGTILVNHNAYNENGNEVNGNLPKVLVDGYILWDSINYRDGTNEYIYSLLSTSETSSSSGIFYSTDNGVNLDLLASITYGRSIIRIGDYVYVVSYEAPTLTVNVVDASIGSNVTYTITDANVSMNAITNIIHSRISGSDLLIFGVGASLYGFDISTHSFTILTDFVTDYSLSHAFSERKMCRLIGKFPNLYIILADYVSTSSTHTILPNANIVSEWTVFDYTKLITEDGTEGGSINADDADDGNRVNYSFNNDFWSTLLGTALNVTSVKLKLVHKSGVSCEYTYTLNVTGLSNFTDTLDPSSVFETTTITLSGITAQYIDSIGNLDFLAGSIPLTGNIYIDFASIEINYNTIEEDTSRTYSYLYKLTNYGTSVDSWVWSQHKTMPKEVICSESIEDYTFLAETEGSSKRVWKLNHTSGVSYLVYTSSYPIKQIGSTLKPSAIYLLLLDGTTYKEVFWSDYSDFCNEAISYQFIQGNVSDASLIFSKVPFFNIVENIHKAYIDIYQYYDKLNPCNLDFYEVDSISDISEISTLTGFDSESIVDYMNHSQLIKLEESVLSGNSATGKMIVDFNKSGEYGTIAFLMGGFSDVVSEANEPFIISLLQSGASAYSVEYKLLQYGISSEESGGFDFNRKIHYVEFDFECTNGGYRGLNDGAFNLKIDGISIFSNQTFTTDKSNIDGIGFGYSSETVSSNTNYVLYLGSILSTMNGDHPLRNSNKGNLTFRGYLDSAKTNDGFVDVHLSGIDSELSSNSNVISQSTLTDKQIMALLVDQMKLLYRENSIDPHDDFSTYYNVQYDSSDYYSMIDIINDREDSIEYRSPNGRIWMHKLNRIYNCEKISSRTSQSYKVINSEVDTNPGKTVNRVVITGQMYSTSDGVIKQSVGVAQDIVSIDMDGIHELIKHVPSCKTPQECKTVATKLLSQSGSALNSPYSLITTQIKMDWLQVGTKINISDSIKDISAADRYMLSLSYDYANKIGVLDVSDGIIQDEDANKENEYKKNQVTVSNEFIESMEESDIDANDQITFRNSIDTLQTGIFNKTNLLMNNYDSKVSFGVIGKDWIVGDNVLNYEDFSGNVSSALIESDTIENEKSYIKIITDAINQYFIYNFGNKPTGEQFIEFNVALANEDDITINVLDSSDVSLFSFTLSDASPGDSPYSLPSGKCYFGASNNGGHLTNLNEFVGITLWMDNSNYWFKIGHTGSEMKESYSGTPSKIKITISSSGSVLYLNAIGISWLGYQQNTNRNNLIKCDNLSIKNKRLGIQLFDLFFDTADEQNPLVVLSNAVVSTGLPLTFCTDDVDHLPFDADYLWARVDIRGGSIGDYIVFAQPNSADYLGYWRKCIALSTSYALSYHILIPLDELNQLRYAIYKTGSTDPFIDIWIMGFGQKIDVNG